MSFLTRFSSHRAGATMIEYAFIASLISIAAVVAMTNIGTQVSAFFTNASGQL